MENQDPLQFWQHIHGGSSHFPIALVMVAFLFDLGATLFKKDSWRTVSFWCLIVASLAAIPAVLSGLAGGNGWFGVEWANKEYSTKMPAHRQYALITTAILHIVTLWRIIRREKLQGAEWFVYLFFLLVATVLVGYTGWLGGYVGHGY